MFLVGLGGFVANFANRKVKGATIDSFWDYFTVDLGNSIGAFVFYMATFAVALETGELTWLTAFGLGYMSDSFVNRYQRRNGNGKADSSRQEEDQEGELRHPGAEGLPHP